MRIRERFNPRAPCGARLWVLFLLLSMRYFNPRAPCGARLKVKVVHSANNNISTHAPLAGRDNYGRESSGEGYGISTHAPLAGRDNSPT